jgi:cysteinyl-tRNA synthetase, unknown class
MKSKRTRDLTLWLVLALVALGLAAAGQVPVERATLEPRVGPPINAVRSWGYQLQNLGLQSIADGTDLLVVDYSRDGSEARVLKADEIERLRTRKDGSKRIVLAYLSIGEAESYRYYWPERGLTGRPGWLGHENPEWKGNYNVRFWLSGWQKIIVRPSVSLLDRLLELAQPSRLPYLDRIIEAGFDGVYLDRVDAFDEWKTENHNAQAEMVAFVAKISSYSKRRRPNFLVVAQNGEELLQSADYRRSLDAVAKEDLFYGAVGSGEPNDPDSVKGSLAELSRMKGEGRPVFVVEYLSDANKRARVLQQLNPTGFVVQFAERDLRDIPEK